MDRKTFNTLITQAAFGRLFNEVGWNNPKEQVQLPAITIGKTSYIMTIVAYMSGFQVMTCPTDKLPSMSLCRSIDSQLRRQADNYICIFTLNDAPLHHLWLCPIVTTEKRDPVIVEYTSLQQAEFLFQKMQSLYFALGVPVTIIDVKQRVQAAFAVNSERITRDFFRGFRQQHQAFADFITGIDDHLKTKDNRQKQWYTSVMLNRLMFCYFIQKKGFLDQDTDYLANKLRWVQQEQGADRFYQSFYRGFLLRLFHGGLNQPTHGNEFEDVYGRIPYLNGGMFDIHQIERDYPDIDISDQAFESLFRFFDQWQWHLDTRLTSSGRDINPDVLGYIFEQYINDRAAMGAYYTKEDITDYIAKNCILPFLFDKVKQTSSKDLFTPSGYVWKTMRDSGQRYIYDAVLRGYTPDWQQQIPDYIARGISTTEPDLLQRRARWNERTAAPFALPTEIWRETIERLRRCDMLTAKISSGEIHEASDLITYNLNIRLFAQDLIDHADDHLFIKHFYSALQNVTILDPTCGSGAFLFAALNILEPLYEGCIERMRQFNADNPNLFKDELAEIDAKYRSNVQYFIYKSIILRNLYGVDIMAEATEIAKLRLFLKMVAVVDVEPDEPNLGLDPLPDVDFNIRCGNTLVGYASEKDIEDHLKEGSDIYQNMINNELRDELMGMMDAVAKTYDVFKNVQLTQEENAEAYKEAKHQLNERLHSLNDTLNHHLHTATAPTTDYNQWLTSHQPFHWIAEFYQIMHDNHGFDVIIGNPPYVECEGHVPYSLSSFERSYANLYAYCVERLFVIQHSNTRNGIIVPMSISSIRSYDILRMYLTRTYNNVYISNHSIRPVPLFVGVSQRVSICFLFNEENSGKIIHTTKYLRTNNTALLFQTINFDAIICLDNQRNNLIPKLNSGLHSSIWTTIHQKKKDIYLMRCRNGGIALYVKDFGESYWISPFNFTPYLTSVKSFKAIMYDASAINQIFQVLNSSLFYIFHATISDCWHFGEWHINEFPISLHELKDLMDDTISFSFKQHRITRYDKRIRGNLYEYHIAKSKPIIDEIDKVLAKHYGFTDEELDFIINYDIKYRMGDELNADDDE